MFAASLSREEWQGCREADLGRVRPWAEDRVRRMARGEKHPVHDFLFEYYSFRPAHLLRWSPGVDVRLRGRDRGRRRLGRVRAVRRRPRSFPHSAFPATARSYLHWAVQLPERGRRRGSRRSRCLGLHEWAMVYRDPNVRHPYVPLRLGRAETDAVVETPAAALHALRRVPLLHPGRGAPQPAGPHPRDDHRPRPARLPARRRWTCTSSRTRWPRSARRPSWRTPSSWRPRPGSWTCGPAPTTSPPTATRRSAIETREGREEYVAAQRELERRSRPVRERLTEVYQTLARHACEEPPPLVRVV